MARVNLWPAERAPRSLQIFFSAHTKQHRDHSLILILFSLFPCFLWEARNKTLQTRLCRHGSSAFPSASLLEFDGSPGFAFLKLAAEGQQLISLHLFLELMLSSLNTIDLTNWSVTP